MWTWFNGFQNNYAQNAGVRNGPFCEYSRKVHRTKFDPKTSPHVFIGYQPNTKGYKVLNIAIRKIHISKDIVFHETIFPFSLITDTTTYPSAPFYYSSIPTHQYSDPSTAPLSKDICIG